MKLWPKLKQIMTISLHILGAPSQVHNVYRWHSLIARMKWTPYFQLTHLHRHHHTAIAELAYCHRRLESRQLCLGPLRCFYVKVRYLIKKRNAKNLRRKFVYICRILIPWIMFDGTNEWDGLHQNKYFVRVDHSASSIISSTHGRISTRRWQCRNLQDTEDTFWTLTDLSC